MEALQRSLAAAKKGEAPDAGERRHMAEPEHRAAARTARKRSAPKAKRATRSSKSRRAAHR
ncbi:MAG: hypothetical protein ACJ79O_11395, partial [Myxococcales bacterium]